MLLTRRAVLKGLAVAPCAARAEAAPSPRQLLPGLDLFEFASSAELGDGKLNALRIDPTRFAFTLLTEQVQGHRRTAREWARAYNLVATTNAAMFAPDGRPVSYCKADNRVVTERVTNDNSVFVFSDASARLLDRSLEAFDPSQHGNALQGIRMIAADGRNVWSQQERQWSIACLAQDGRGRILFLQKRTPMSVHDFVNYVQGLPLGLARCMYLEGGPEATLYVNAGGIELERFGSYESGFNENDDNDRAWQLPNVIGVRSHAA
jgi:Phosphodiester glycosidase